MDERLYANATSLTDMDRRKALAEVGYEEEEKTGAILCMLRGKVVEDSLFGEGNRYPDLSVVRSVEGRLFAVSGLPFASRLFVYTLWGIEEKRKVTEKTVFSVKRVGWESVRMTRGAVVILLGELLKKRDKRSVDAFFSDGGWTEDQAYREASSEFKEKNYAFQLKHIGSRIFAVEKKSDALRETVWRLLICHEEFAFLCQGTDVFRPIYPLKLVLRMNHVDINEMIANLKIRPLDYAFDATIDSYWCGGYQGASVKVPEITLETLQLLAARHPKAKEWWFGAAKIYRGLKAETWKERHCATPESELSRFVSNGDLRKTSLNWLLANEILKRSANGLILAEIDEWEVCLKEALKKILGTNAETEFPDPADLRTRSDHPLCDEQRRAFGVLTKRPVLLVDGKAGSGKTDFLSAVASSFPPYEILATAYQGTNAGDLAKIFPGKAYTTHKIIYQHAGRCPGPPESEDEKRPFSARGKETASCPLAGTKVLVVDELGTQSLDVFSKLLSALAICGSVEKVILTGDSGQLPPINPGDVLLALRSFLGDRGMYVRFDHNHRQNRGARLLAENAVAISRGEMPRFDGKSCVHVDPRDAPLEGVVVKILDDKKIGERDNNVVTRTNELRKKIIPLVEEHYSGYSSRVGQGMLVGRKMSFTQNDYDRGIVNNEILTLEEVLDVGGPRPGYKNFTGGATSGAERTIKATSLEGRRIELEWDGWTRGHCRKASSTTVNVFQGAQIPWIIYPMPYYCSYETRERVYTTFTRPTRGIVFVGKLRDLENAVKNPEPRKRSDLVAKLESIPENLRKKRKRKRKDPEKE